MAIFFLCSLFIGTTCSYLQGFVIPNQTSSKRWSETVRTGQSQDGAGTELSATGTVASQAWHIPSHLPQVLPGGYTQLCHGNSPQLLCRSAGWAGGQSRRQREEGQITAEGSCSVLSKCTGNFNLPNLITLVLGNKSFQWSSGLNPLCWGWQTVHWFDAPSNPPSYTLWGEDKIFCVKKHTQELYRKGDIRTANLMT